MNIKTKEIRELVFKSIGEASAVFMSKEVKGTEMVMPVEELQRIGDELVDKISDIIYNSY